MIENLDHFAISVWDIDKSLPYYTETLGMQIIHDELLPSAGVRLLYLGVGNTMLQLVQPIGETPIRQHLTEHGEGLHHICLSVDNIPQFLETLPDEKNIKVGVGGRGRRTCFLNGKPNGLRIELTEIEPYAG